MAIEFIPATCPSCGGELRVPNNRDTLNCMYCGKQIIIHNPNNDPQRANIDNWMKLANTIGDSNPQEGYQYYSKVLEFEPENSLAWFGKGHCAGKLSTLLHPTVAEMMTCFLKSIELVDEELKKGRMRAIYLDSLKFIGWYYTLTLQSYRNGQNLNDLTNELDLVITIYDVLLSKFPDIDLLDNTLDSAIHCCDCITQINIVPKNYKIKMNQKISEYKQIMQTKKV